MAEDIAYSGGPDLWKYRSVYACLVDGWTFCVQRFFTYVKYSLPLIVLFAFLLTFICYHLPLLPAASGVGEWIMLPVAGLLLLLSVAGLQAYLYSLLLHTEQRDGGRLSWHSIYAAGYGHMLGAALGSMLCSLVVVSLSLVAGWGVWRLTAPLWGAWPAMACVALTLMLLWALFVPLEQVLPHAILQKGGAWTVVKTAYRRSWQHWSKVAGVSFCSWMLLLVLLLLLCIPMLVYTAMRWQYMESMLAGDHVELPLGILLSTQALAFIAFALFGIAVWISAVHQAYMAVSLMVDEMQEQDEIES